MSQQDVTVTPVRVYTQVGKDRVFAKAEVLAQDLDEAGGE